MTDRQYAKKPTTRKRPLQFDDIIDRVAELDRLVVPRAWTGKPIAGVNRYTLAPKNALAFFTVCTHWKVALAMADGRAANVKGKHDPHQGYHELVNRLARRHDAPGVVIAFSSRWRLVRVLRWERSSRVYDELKDWLADLEQRGLVEKYRLPDKVGAPVAIHVRKEIFRLFDQKFWMLPWPKHGLNLRSRAEFGLEILLRSWWDRPMYAISTDKLCKRLGLRQERHDHNVSKLRAAFRRIRRKFKSEGWRVKMEIVDGKVSFSMSPLPGATKGENTIHHETHESGSLEMDDETRRRWEDAKKELRRRREEEEKRRPGQRGEETDDDPG